MAAAISFLTLQEFDARHGDRKPYYEYWFGEAFPLRCVAYRMWIDRPQPVVAAELTAGPGLAPVPLDELWREADAMLTPAL